MIYRPEIDGLRAVAVLPVILFHAGVSPFTGGYVGVDVFFVISGYLITNLIIEELESNRFSLAGFYERRARRILPALFLVMASCIPFAWFWLLPRDMEQFSQSLIAVPTFVSNILFWKTSNYFDIASELKPLLHTWSLAVEEQYYLLFPILLSWLYKKNRRIVVPILAIIAMASFALAQWGTTARPDAAYYILPTRAWEILVGALSATGRWKINTKPRQITAEVGSLLGLALIGFSITAYTKYTPFPGIYALAPTIGACLVIVFASRNSIAGKILASPVAVNIGLISYSAYLWHQPFLAFARHRIFEGLGNTHTTFIILATFLFAYGTWRFVEAPFRSRKFTATQVISSAVILSLVFLTIGAYGAMSAGLPDRFSRIDKYEGDIGQVEFYNSLDNNNFLCDPTSIANSPANKVTFRCLQTKPTTPPDVALIGDSHAEHLFPGLSEINRNINLLIYAKGSYPTLSNAEFNDIYEYIGRTKSIHSVVITSYWINRIQMASAATDIKSDLIKTIAFLQKNGKTVYLLGDVPDFPFPPERCKFLSDNMGSEVCTINRDYVTKQEGSYSNLLIEISRLLPDVKYLDMPRFFCTEITCSMLASDKLLYRDSHHLNILGSRHVARHIAIHLPNIFSSERIAKQDQKLLSKDN